MDNPKTLIKTLTKMIDNKELKITIESFVSQHREEVNAKKNILDTLTDEIYMLERENKEIEDAILDLKLTQSKNNDAYNKKNNERYKMASKMISVEQHNEELENEIEELMKSVNVKEEAMKSINYPSTEVLYHEIVRGFGVSFVDKNNVRCIRIMNKIKNDVYEIALNDGIVEEICERVWELIE